MYTFLKQVTIALLIELLFHLQFDLYDRGYLKERLGLRDSEAHRTTAMPTGKWKECLRGSFHKAHALYASQDRCPPAPRPHVASERQSLAARNTAVTHYPLTVKEVLWKQFLYLFSFGVINLGPLNVGMEITHNNNNNKNALLP